jgi:hypothetical protein
MRDAAPGNIQADIRHRLFELLSVFRPLDRLEIGADHFNTEILEHTPFGNLDGRVQGGLPPDGG